MKINKKMKKAFTLVELVVVIAVIAILSAVSVGAYFGITDSANASAATNYHKQAKDFWLIYATDSKAGLDSNKSLDATGKHFCIDYNEENGANLNLNYQVVTINETKDSSSVNSLKRAYNSTLDKEALLFKVEGVYSTWFIVDNERIIDESEVLKSDNEFDTSVKDSKFVITENGRNYTQDTFVLTTLTDINGENPVKGIRYVQYNVTETGYNYDTPKIKTFYALNGISLNEHTDDYLPNKMAEDPISKVTAKLYDLTDDQGNEYDSTKRVDLGNKYLAKNPNDPYGYIIQEVSVTRTWRNNASINFLDYEAIVVTNEKYTVFDSFDDVNLETLADGQVGYIFINNAELTKSQFTVKSGYNIVVEYELDNIKNASTIADLITHHSTSDINKISRFVRTTSSQFSYLESDKINLDANYKIIDTPHSFVTCENEFLISTDSKLLFESNTKFIIEALVYVANSTNGMGIGQHSRINNNGIIELQDNSIMKTMGRVDGTGSIVAKNGSQIIDLFKITSFNGGTLTVKYVSSKLPIFKDYLFDNIASEISFEAGSRYKLISLLGVTHPTNKSNIKMDISIDFIGGDNSSSFIEMYNASLLKKTMKNSTNVFTFEKGVFDFKNVLLSISALGEDGSSLDILGSLVTIPSMSICDSPFPLSHLGLSILEDSTLNINDKFNFRMYENSYIYVKGKLNIDGGAQLLVINNNPNSIEDTFYDKLEDYVSNPIKAYKTGLYTDDKGSNRTYVEIGKYAREVISYETNFNKYMKTNYYDAANPNPIVNVTGVVTVEEGSEIYVTAKENLSFNNSNIVMKGTHSVDSVYNYRTYGSGTIIFDQTAITTYANYYYRYGSYSNYKYVLVEEFVKNPFKYDTDVFEKYQNYLEIQDYNSSIVGSIL